MPVRRTGTAARGNDPKLSASVESKINLFDIIYEYDIQNIPGDIYELIFDNAVFSILETYEREMPSFIAASR